MGELRDLITGGIDKDRREKTRKKTKARKDATTGENATPSQEGPR